MFKTGNKEGKGRITGSKNIDSTKIRTAFASLLENNLGQIEQDIKDIENPKDRVKLLIDLAAYVIPKLRQVEIEQTTVDKDFQPVILEINGDK